MRSGRSVLGVIAGVLLALGVVALVGSGLNPHASNTGEVPASYIFYGTNLSTATGQQGQGSIFSINGLATPPSQVSSVAKQPATLTGFVLLPILVAFFLGFVLYRVSRVRLEEEEPPEAA
ncbi:MAG: hypothetical protein ABSB53_04835 [Nitrososphaerales archaeon]|jgi:hypothetical protein